MRRLLTLVALLLAVSTATVSCGSSGARGRAELTFTRFAGQPESVWVAAADGSHAREITANGRASTLSPDGRWLTFERDETQPGSEFMRLFLVDLTTGRTRPLGETSGNERWSPVGARLAVSERHGFFLIDAASGNRTRLLRSRVSSFDFTPDGSSIVLARSKGSVYLDFERSDLFLLGLSDHRLKRLTRDGHSRSPLVSRSGIAYVRFKQAYDAYEVWLMGRDGSGQRLLARCCETKWYTTHVSTHGFATVALSADGKHLLACQPWEGGCYPVAIALPDGRRYAFPEARKLGTPKESASAVDLTRDGRTALIVVNPWDDEPGPRLLYAVPFTGGKPTLLARGVADGRWRR